jgi:hypothetical protein
VDTVTVYRALWRKLAHGEDPRDGFAEERVAPGEAGPAGAVRRTLIIGGRSLAPNAFALGIDTERGVNHVAVAQTNATGVVSAPVPSP